MPRGDLTEKSTQRIMRALTPIQENFLPTQFQNLLKEHNIEVYVESIPEHLSKHSDGLSVDFIDLDDEDLIELFNKDLLNKAILSACRLHPLAAKFVMEHEELKNKLPLEEITLPTDLERIKSMFRFGFKRAKLECDDQHIYDLNLIEITVDKINNSLPFYLLNLCTFFMPFLIMVIIDILVTFVVNAINSIKGFAEGMYYGWHWAGRNVPDMTAHFFNNKPPQRVCEISATVIDESDKAITKAPFSKQALSNKESDEASHQQPPRRVNFDKSLVEIAPFYQTLHHEIDGAGEIPESVSCADGYRETPPPRPAY
jgi:hypothetical protein